jgi:hypothetical protein
MRLRAPGRARSVLVMLPGLLALAACTGLPPQPTQPGPVVGQGAVTSEDRTSSEFQHLSVGGGLRVVVTSGSPLSVTLSAQPNLLPLITTEVDGGQLVVNISSPGISSSQPITLTATVPDLQSMTLSGGANGTLQTTAADLGVDVSGGAWLEATGSAANLALSASGGGQARLSALVVQSASITLSGGAVAELNVVSDLSGTASEGANVRLTQRPTSLSVTTSGGAIIQDG